MKCNPDKALELREQFPDAVLPGYHMNKKHWNTLHINKSIPTKLDKQWIQNSKYKANLIEHGRVENDLISGLTGRQQIEKRMREADVLLLLHGDTEWCREYIPSKLYDYLWTNRPIWGLIYKNEMLWNLLAERNHFISNSNDQKTILKTLYNNDLHTYVFKIHPS